MAGRYERGEVIITLGGSGSGRRVGPDLLEETGVAVTFRRLSVSKLRGRDGRPT